MLQVYAHWIPSTVPIPVFQSGTIVILLESRRERFGYKAAHKRSTLGEQRSQMRTWMHRCVICKQAVPGIGIFSTLLLSHLGTDSGSPFVEAQAKPSIPQPTTAHPYAAPRDGH
ncbi:hypothetical protein F5Y11DRAFT_7551 [Daldinia sp. FL1419]|nr:hypothetical protein F5Y11DRAFT_7551 [Daldinia sp. FL1419]